jgi:hypothetical protein
MARRFQVKAEVCGNAALHINNFEVGQHGWYLMTAGRGFEHSATVDLTAFGERGWL